MTFGAKIRATRLARNLSQSELAALTGISERSLYTYEQTNTMPRSDKIQKLAKALEVSVSYLMDEHESDTEKNINQDDFLAHVQGEFGSRGKIQAMALLQDASALFAGGELDDNAKDAFFQSFMEVYMESKSESRAKFSPKSRVKRKEKAQNT